MRCLLAVSAADLHVQQPAAGHVLDGQVGPKMLLGHLPGGCPNGPREVSSLFRRLECPRQHAACLRQLGLRLAESVLRGPAWLVGGGSGELRGDQDLRDGEVLWPAGQRADGPGDNDRPEDQE